jgi:hypothetical protein
VSNVVDARGDPRREADFIVRTTRVAPAVLEHIETGLAPRDRDAVGRVGVDLDLLADADSVVEQPFRTWLARGFVDQPESNILQTPPVLGYIEVADVDAYFKDPRMWGILQ